jgi:transposase, IS30 family
LRAQGWRLADIAREIGCTAPMVGLMVREGRHRDAKPLGWKPRPGCLSIGEREQILLGIGRGNSLSAIARRLGRVPSTITREVNANGGRQGYSAWQAHQRAHAQARRPKPRKLRRGRLLQEVSRRLEHLWSPQQISRRLRLEYPDDPGMRVSPETIYQSLFVQGRGELRRELAKALRTGRTMRRSHRQSYRRQPRMARDMVMISDRPAEAADRAVPGHWEGDLIIGKAHKSAIGTLIERSSRLVTLVHLPEGRRPAEMRDALIQTVSTLPAQLRRSLTWDQGSEMHLHKDFSIATDMPVFFCDPGSPWQRGSNENTNGLLRQYFPKGTSLASYTREELDAVAAELNSRPRKTLGWETPAERLAKLLATAR